MVSVVVNMDAQLDESSVDDVSQCEDGIVTRGRELLNAAERHELRDTFDDILRPLGLYTRLVVLDRANSIALYFICMTLSSVLSELWRCGQLQNVIQILFTFLSGASQPVLVHRLSWPLSDDERCRIFFGLLSS